MMITKVKFDGNLLNYLTQADSATEIENDVTIVDNMPTIQNYQHIKYSIYSVPRRRIVVRTKNSM